MPGHDITENDIISLYASFDAYPAPKGAAVHIREFSTRLFAKYKNGLLLAVGDETMPKWQIEDNAQIKRCSLKSGNYLERALEFACFVQAKARECDALQIAHFRDPWGGVPLILTLGKKCPIIYEVNALSSIELPVRYSSILPATLNKIRDYEKFCLDNCDEIVCPSETIKKCLIDLGQNENKITVIPNGANINAIEIASKPESAPEKYIIYVGAAQAWQGIEILLKAMKFLRDINDLKLVLCVSGSKQRIKYLMKVAKLWELEDKIVWNLRLPQKEVIDWLSGALFSVAPLIECERNLVQGCSPIKITESMALKKIVLASDLPVTREIIQNNKTGILVRPDRPAELARAIRLLLANPQKLTEMGDEAYKYIKVNLTWEHSLNKLERVYERAVYNHINNERKTDKI